ncbi:hypothetical protein EV643_104212 [Kribbella sp. VKM Ac-2527]|uniref:Uncharacterized protein n=1 Tax=Kribbella caucasensis TaxID=2512215 RepID=A0A4V3CAP4_9ACTN|nr:hypothetical protein EV643_104212 [Kribbella sp. VKM Ac-2527]
MVVDLGGVVGIRDSTNPGPRYRPARPTLCTRRAYSAVRNGRPVHKVAAEPAGQTTRRTGEGFAPQRDKTLPEPLSRGVEAVPGSAVGRPGAGLEASGVGSGGADGGGIGTGVDG